MCLTWGPLHRSISGPHLQEEHTEGQSAVAASWTRASVLEVHLPVDRGGGRGHFLVEDTTLELVVLQGKSGLF